jgi:uncharacterized membrane protein
VVGAGIIDYFLLYIAVIDHVIYSLAENKQVVTQQFGNAWAILISFFHNYVPIEYLLNNPTQKKV